MAATKKLKSRPTRVMANTDSLYLLKAHLVLNELRKTLHKIFILGTNKPPSMTVKNYLIGRGTPNVMLKKIFNRNQMERLDNDPNGDTFDISLLYTCIQKTCKNVADFDDPIWNTPGSTFEYTLYSLKNLRNRLAHGDYVIESECQLEDFLAEVMEKLKFIYEQAGIKYDLKKSMIDSLISESNESIHAILNMNDVGIHERETYVRTKGKKELQISLSQVLCTASSNVMLPFQRLVDVSDTFDCIDIVMAEKGQQRSSLAVNAENLLEINGPRNEHPSLILIEGAAGVGKTTLLRSILSQWSNESATMVNLLQYELVLYMECRNTSITDFGGLLKSQMPGTSRMMTDDHLIEAVLNLKILVIVDSLDELNSSSSRLLSDLLKMPDSYDMQMLITTRPEKVDYLCRTIPRNLTMCHLKITGVPVERRQEFLTKLMRNIPSTEVIAKLTSITATPWLSNLLRLPLNLVLIAYLWIQSPQSIEWLRTSTSLYNEIFKLTRKKLFERLLVNEVTAALTARSLDECISQYLQAMFRESINAVKLSNVTLSEESIALLKEKCLQLRLPVDEIFSAFFSVTMSHKDSKATVVGYPHKELRDFYAAHAIYHHMKWADDEMVIERVSKAVQDVMLTHMVPVGLSSQIGVMIEEVVSKNRPKSETVIGFLIDLHHDNPKTFSLERYQKVLIHLIGLLKMENGLPKFRVAELVKLLKEANLKDGEQWLNIVTETECDPNVVSEVKTVLPDNYLYIRDSNLKAALSVLPGLEVYYVDISISGDPSKLAHLKDVLCVLSKSHCQLRLTLQHHWRHPELVTSDEFLSCLIGKHDYNVRLTYFMGSLRSLSSLSESIESLYVALGSQYTHPSDKEFGYFQRIILGLDHLYIHISRKVSIKSLPDISKIRFPVDLWFSEIDDSSVQWVGEAIQKLASKFRPFWSIRFPRSTLSTEGCLKLAGVLEKILIGTDGVMVSSSKLDKGDVPRIEAAFNGKMKRSFRLSDEVKIWMF